MRPTLALLTAGLLAALLSGCAAGAGDPITMKSGLGPARTAASAWGEEPELLGAFAIEPFERIEEKGEDGSLQGEFVTHLDNSPGDGRAPGWMYAFFTSDGRCVFVAYASGLGVLAEGWEDCSEAQAEGDVPVLPGGLLDSDEVAKILGDLEGWPEPDPAITYTWELESLDGTPMWEVSAGSPDLYVEAEVDALTGEALLVEQELDGDGDFGPAAPGEDGSYEYGEAWASGASPFITVATPIELTMDVGEGATMTVVATTGMGLVGPAEVAVIDQDSATVVASKTFAAGTQELVLEDLPGDTYVIRLSHSTGALSGSLDATAHWVIG